MPRIKNVHRQSAPPGPEPTLQRRNPTRHVETAILLRQLLDVIDREKGPHGFNCGCENCHDIRAMRLTLGMYSGWIESNLFPWDSRLDE